MKLDIKIKNGDNFYFVEDEKILSGKVDKIEIFEDYFRYVNEDNSVMVNWFTNDSIDNDRTESSDSITTRIFTTEQKARDGYEFKHNMLHSKIDKIRLLFIEIKNMENVKLFYPEEKLNKIQYLLNDVKEKYIKV